MKNSLRLARESTNPFEFCFDEETNQLCTRNIKSGKIKKIPDKKLEKNIKSLEDKK